jgi:hypothetical protein
MIELGTRGSRVVSRSSVVTKKDEFVSVGEKLKLKMDEPLKEGEF